jgi:divalent metal cation (Fe/Co/Zn/Cd) transporter
VKPVEQALRVSYAAIAWTLVTGVIGVVVGVSAASTALVGTSADVLADMASSAVLVWRFRAELHGHPVGIRAEHIAERVAASALSLVALGIAIAAVLRLSSGESAEESPLSLVIAIASIVVLPLFAVAKYRLAATVPSAALRMDGHITLVGAGMAVITLVGLALTSAYGWAWADPSAALVVAALALAVGARTLIASEQDAA